ncbi:MAG: hypothetical protein SynsKO_16680 [Synoicihabitans sp.]
MIKNYPSRYVREIVFSTFAFLSLVLGITQVFAQERTSSTVEEDETIELNPFTVSSDTGYIAQRTIYGTRLNSELKDVPQQVSVFTEDFLADIDALSPEEAMLYSVNVENNMEFSDPISASGNFNVGIAFNNFSGRVRGIDSAGRMRDFFNTNLQSDNYNLAGGISVSSGPNAVVFGLGGTGGVISTGYKKATASRNAYGVDIRTDSEGSFRVVSDINKVLLKDKLAFRVVALDDHFETHRNGSRGDQERYFFSVTANPWKSGSLTAYYENVGIQKGLPRNVVAYDGGVTAYLEHVANGGAPFYDNSISNAIQPGWENIVERVGQNRDFWYHLPDGTQTYVGRSNQGTVRNTVQTIDPSRRDSDPLNRYRWSLPEDSPLVSLEHNIHGLTTNRRMVGDIYGAILTQQLRKNLHIELGYNFETGDTHYTSMAQPGAAVVRVDTNLYLPDKVTPNPYKGMYYVDHWGQSTSDFNELESFRATISWDLDFTDKNKWLGRHQVMGLYTVDQIDRMWSWLRTKTVHPDNVDSYIYNAGSGRGQGQTYYRWYLDENFEMVNPWDPYKGGAQPDGSFVWARGNAPASGFTWSQLKKEKGATAAIQSFWLDSRLVTTVGYRYGWFQDGAATVPFIRNTPEVAFGRPNIPDVDRSLDTYSPEYSEDAINYGLVYHVTGAENRLGEISFFYNFADIFTSPTPARFPDNSRVPSPTGESFDFGLMWQAPSGKFGGRLNYYKTESKSLRSTAWQNSIKNPVRNIENRIGFPGESAEDENAYAVRIADGEIVDASGNVVTLADIAANPQLAFRTDGFDITTPNSIHGMTADRESTGYELEAWANPTENITVRLTAAKNKATDQALMKGWDTWIDKRYQYWKAWAEWEHNHFAELPTNDPLSDAGNSVTETFAQVSPGYSTLTTIDGAQVNQNVGLRLNLTARYSFRQGVLKGLDAGASYRFREAPVIGYIATPAENFFPDFPYPDNAQTEFTASNLDRPVHADDQHDIDMFLSYRGRLKDETRYNIRFNVRNVFDNTDVIQQRANSRGETVIYSFKPPRTYSMTLGFDF